MNVRNTILLIASSLISAAAGFGAGYFFTKNKFEAKADKEIESVKAAFEKHFNHPCEEDSAIENNNGEMSRKPEPIEDIPQTPGPIHTQASDEKSYVNYSEKYNPTKENPVSEILKGKEASGKRKPYVISELDYIRRDDYIVESLTYYHDKVLADDNENIVKNIIEVIGEDACTALDNLNENEDRLYVRDDDLQKDYIIYYSEQIYSEVHNIEEDN